MMAKVVFIIPCLLGAIVAWIVGSRANWSTDLWVLPLILGAFLGLSLGLAARRLIKDVAMGRTWNKWGGDISLKKKFLVELCIFVLLLVGIATPLSAHRGIIIGDYAIPARILLICGALLVGVSLFVALLRRDRKL